MSPKASLEWRLYILAKKPRHAACGSSFHGTVHPPFRFTWDEEVIFFGGTTRMYSILMLNWFCNIAPTWINFNCSQNDLKTTKLGTLGPRAFNSSIDIEAPGIENHPNRSRQLFNSIHLTDFSWLSRTLDRVAPEIQDWTQLLHVFGDSLRILWLNLQWF